MNHKNLKLSPELNICNRLNPIWEKLKRTELRLILSTQMSEQLLNLPWWYRAKPKFLRVKNSRRNQSQQGPYPCEFHNQELYQIITMNSGENFPHGTRRGRGTIWKHSRWHSSSYQGLLPEEMIYLNPNLINPVGVLLEPNLSGKGKYLTLAPSSLLPGRWKYSTYFQMSPAILSHQWRVGT